MRAKLFSSILATGLSAYSAGWDHMAVTVQSEVDAWIAAQQARGLHIEYEKMQIEGYPYKPVLHMQAVVVTLQKKNEAG